MIKLNGAILNLNHFPDGTFRLLDFHINAIRRDSTPMFAIIEWKYESNEEQILLFNIVKHLRDIVGNDLKIDLYMPYVPNARMDRVSEENKDKQIFTLKWFCEFINSLNFNQVFVTDAHSEITLQLLNNVVHLNCKDIIMRLAKSLNVDLLFYPDAGACCRYSKFIDWPYLCGERKKNPDTGEMIDIDIPGDIPKGSFNILMVDDICSYGTTFLLSAKKLKETGADKIYAYATHCENSILDGEFIGSGLIEKIYTTDSIFTKHHELIEILKN